MAAHLSGNGGKRLGQFAKGCAPGPGWRKGGHNKATISGERVKREILAVWDKIDGPKLLAEWARDNFGEFMRVILQIVPREEIIDVKPGDNGVGLRLIFNRASEVLGDGDADGDRFIDAPAADDLPRLAARPPSGTPCPFRIVSKEGSSTREPDPVGPTERVRPVHPPA